MGKEGDEVCPIEADLSDLASTPTFFTCGKLSRPVPCKLSHFIVFWILQGASILSTLTGNFR